MFFLGEGEFVERDAWFSYANHADLVVRGEMASLLIAGIEDLESVVSFCDQDAAMGEVQWRGRILRFRRCPLLALHGRR